MGTLLAIFLTSILTRCNPSPRQNRNFPRSATQNRPDGKLPSGGSWLLSLRGCIVPLRPHQEGSILDEFSPRVKEKPPDSSRHKDSCFLRTASLLVSMGQVKEVDMNEIIFLVEPDPVGG